MCMNKEDKHTITVFGAGYVGLSMGVLLSEHHQVYIVDVLPEKIRMINEKESPIVDKEIQEYLKYKNLHLTGTLNAREAITQSNYIIVAVPTNYDVSTNTFDTSIVESVVKTAVKYNPYALIIIKSTVPIGFTRTICEQLKTNRIVFSPDFLREGKALYDNLYPSRIIVGFDSMDSFVINKVNTFMDLLKENALKEEIEMLSVGSMEAEAIKLFSNTYLALRISFFNELDTFAETNNLNTKQIIDGVCLDPRIGGYYNNPSFGYGGYCLPKDTKQLLASFHGIPENIISAVVSANDTRKQFMITQIQKYIEQKRKESQKQEIVVGVYRLTMKSQSDNFRESAIQDILRQLNKENIRFLLYEPTLKENTFLMMDIQNNLDKFKASCDIILANRYDKELDDVKEKVYTRDIFYRD